MTPLWLLIKRIDRMALPERIDFTSKLITHEKPHSIRRKELTEYLKKLRTLELRKANRAA